MTVPEAAEQLGIHQTAVRKAVSVRRLAAWRDGGQLFFAMKLVEGKTLTEQTDEATGISQKVVIEAGATGGWWRYAGARGAVVGIDSFGHSAPAKQLFEHLK